MYASLRSVTTKNGKKINPYPDGKFFADLNGPANGRNSARRVVSKTKHSKTKTEARSTQISKAKHPRLENEAPKSRKRRTQDSKTKHPKLENEAPKTRNLCVL